MGKRSSEMARFRQTCCLGVPSEVLVPQIIEELHRIIPAERMHFAWTDDLGNIVNAFFEKPNLGALEYLKNNYLRIEEDVGVSFRSTILFGKATGNFRWPYRAGFEQTESYARLWRALNLRYAIDGVLRDSFRPFGQIVLFRSDNEPDFSASDEEALTQALPYLTHAISGPHKTPDAFVETGESGLIVFDAAGEVSYQSQRAKELCVYAMHEQIPVGLDVGYNAQEADTKLSGLYDRVKRAYEAEDRNSEPPLWSIKNVWGEFQVRAYLLGGSNGTVDSYGVTIEKKIPVEVKILQKVKELPLSNKQREVCFLLLRGASTESIAMMLGVSASTLKEYTKTVYKKVGVSNRAELTQLLAG